MRSRNCTNPPPINNGADCQGPRDEMQLCNLQLCPGTTSVYTEDASVQSKQLSKGVLLTKERLTRELYTVCDLANHTLDYIKLVIYVISCIALITVQ